MNFSGFRHSGQARTSSREVFNRRSAGGDSLHRYELAVVQAYLVISRNSWPKARLGYSPRTRKEPHGWLKDLCWKTTLRYLIAVRFNISKLNPEEDAHGHAMWDQFLGKRALYAIERSDGFLDIREADHFFLTYNGWAELHKQAMKHVKGRILDIGCGVGRHALYLQSKGYDITGIDRSPLAIEVCKRRGLKHAVVGDMNTMNFTPASFDTLLMMGNGFGLLGSKERGRRLLKRWHPLVSKHGIIVAEANNPNMTKSPLDLAYQERNRRRGRMPGQIRVRIRYRQYRTRWFDILLASKEEVKRLVRGTGWRVKGYLDGEGPYYLVILEKTAIH